MTKEQLLVYIWSIYPEGGAKDFWVVLLILYSAFIIVIYFAYLLNDAEEGSEEEREYDKDDKKERHLFIRLGKWKVSGILFLLFIIFLCNLVPKKEHFIYIVATPFVIESGKTILESLQDPNSKLFKLNKITDKSLERLSESLDNPDIDLKKEYEELLKYKELYNNIKGGNE